MKKGGNVVIYAVKPGKNGKVVLEFAQRIITPKSSPFSSLNASDPKFIPPKPVKTWLTVEPIDIVAKIPALKDTVEYVTSFRQRKICEVLDPTLEGELLKLQIIESTQDELYEEYYLEDTPATRRREIEYLFQNYETMAKRKGQTGNFIVGENRAIVFREVFVTYGQKDHKFIIQRGSIIWPNIPSFGVELVDPITIEERTLIKS